MFGLFTVRKAFLLSILVVPLSLATLYTMYHLSSVYLPLSRYINLSQAAEVTHGATAGDVVQLRSGHPVTTSQTNLNRGRYAHQGDGIYAVAKVRAFPFLSPLSLTSIRNSPPKYPSVIDSKHGLLSTTSLRFVSWSTLDRIQQTLWTSSTLRFSPRAMASSTSRTVPEPTR